MRVGVRFDDADFKRQIAKLQNPREVTTRIVRRAAETVGEAEVRDRTPVDKGDLRRSTATVPTPNGAKVRWTLSKRNPYVKILLNARRSKVFVRVARSRAVAARVRRFVDREMRRWLRSL